MSSKTISRRQSGKHVGGTDGENELVTQMDALRIKNSDKRVTRSSKQTWVLEIPACASPQGFGRETRREATKTKEPEIIVLSDTDESDDSEIELLGEANRSGIMQTPCLSTVSSPSNDKGGQAARRGNRSVGARTSRPVLVQKTPSASAATAPAKSKPLKLAVAASRRRHSAAGGVLPSISDDEDESPSAAVSGRVTTAQKDERPKCTAITRQGTQCTFRVKNILPLAMFKADATVGLQQYCGKHINAKSHNQEEVYLFRVRKYLKFSDWISPHLQKETQIALRDLMVKDPAANDTDGYIYVMEVRDAYSNDYLQLKIGRSNNPLRRLQQWVSKCPDAHYIFRGYWPDGLEERKVLMMGQIQVGLPSPFVCLLERLILLELADTAANPPWLETKPQPLGKIICPSCKEWHREIIRFPRAKTGKDVGMEWLRFIAPVIARWGQYVKENVRAFPSDDN